MGDQTRAEHTWQCLVAACLVVGAAASLFVIDARHSLWIATVTSAVVFTVAVTLAYEPTGLVPAARNGTIAAAVAIGLFGWLGLLGFAVPLVAMLLGCLHPACLRRWAELLDRGAPPAGPACATYEQLTTTALVHTWKINYWALTTSPDPDVRARAAESRRRCLEELERRDPAGVRLWLAAGAKADGDPSAFLRCDEAPRRPAA